jgi:hypothetical protein
MQIFRKHLERLLPYDIIGVLGQSKESSLL